MQHIQQTMLTMLQNNALCRSLWISANTATYS